MSDEIQAIPVGWTPICVECVAQHADAVAKMLTGDMSVQPQLNRADTLAGGNAVCIPHMVAAVRAQRGSGLLIAQGGMPQGGRQ